VFFDNRYVEGSSTPISRRDAQGNTYQARKLDNGSAHEVLKNFPTERELIERASAHGLDAKEFTLMTNNGMTPANARWFGLDVASIGRRGVHEPRELLFLQYHRGD